jgi:hypothetical protein
MKIGHGVLRFRLKCITDPTGWMLGTNQKRLLINECIVFGELVRFPLSPF